MSLLMQLTLGVTAAAFFPLQCAPTTCSKDDLRKFAKFACNQERIPWTNPNRDEVSGGVVHVPPYPMIIAPAQGTGWSGHMYSIQWNLSIEDTIGTQLAVLYIVEPLYRGHFWDPAGCPVYSETSL